MIELKNVSFAYREHTPLTLRGITLTLHPGEFTAVIGHNGCGKSTLARHLNGILVPGEGDIFVEGVNTKDDDRLLFIRSTVGMVFQNPDNQIVSTVVEEDVAFALENLGVPSSEIRHRVDEALQTVSMTEHRLDCTYHLSGGQKQRVAIAGVLAMQPDYIVLDEPTAMLDPKGRRQVLQTLCRLKQLGIGVVLITHYMEEAAQADRVIVMERGRVVMDDTPHRVFEKELQLKQLGLCVPDSTELYFALKHRGVDMGGVVINETEFADKIEETLWK